MSSGETTEKTDAVAEVGDDLVRRVEPERVVFESRQAIPRLANDHLASAGFAALDPGSTVTAPVTSSALESGTEGSRCPVEGDSRIGVAMSAPGWPSVTPPAYVPGFAPSRRLRVARGLAEAPVRAGLSAST